MKANIYTTVIISLKSAASSLYLLNKIELI